MEFREDILSPADSLADGEVAEVVKKNVRTMLHLRNQVESKKGLQQKFSSSIPKYAGRLSFVYCQATFMTLWVFINLSFVPYFPHFDPFPFSLLGLITTTEAIFLAIFILINQNRMSEVAKRREELDIQVALLTEHEVTRLIQLVDTIAIHLKISSKEPEIQDLKKEIQPDKVLEVIESEIDNLKNENEGNI
jgi:uncharacterized membrane protein